MIIPITLDEDIRRLESKTDEMDIDNLEEYTIGSCIGSELTEFYKEIMEEVIGEALVVSGNEISDGKYEIHFLMPNGQNYLNISKAWFSKENVKKIILDILYCYYEDLRKNAGVNSQYNNCKVESASICSEEVVAVIMMEYEKLIDVELYTKEDDAIEAFENWIELSYADYIEGYKMDDKYNRSCILKRKVTVDKKSEDEIANTVLKHIIFGKNSK